MALNINTPLFTPEEIEALRADLVQPKLRDPEQVDLASGDHALRKVIPIVERRLELFSGAVDLSIARVLREALSSKADPPDVVGPRTALGTLREMSMVAEIHSEDMGLIGFIGIETLLSFLVIERSFGAAIVEGPNSDENWSTPQRSRLTDVERETLLPTLDSLIQELYVRVFEESGGALTLESVPAGLPPELPPQVESTILWRVHFDLGGNTSGFALLLLPNLVEILIQKDRPDPRVLPSWLAMHLTETRVRVSTTLGKISLSTDELLALNQ